MTRPLNLPVRIAIVLASATTYALLFPLLEPNTGPATAALSFIPMAITGWLLGVRGVLILSAMNIPLNNYLFAAQGDYATANNVGASIVANSALMLIGAVIAWVRSLLDRVHKYAGELQDERRYLREEVERRKKAEERLAHEALHDPLTNLPNRRLFLDRLEHAIERNKRHPNDRFAVAYLDFDRFKMVNDSLGHAVGDQVLVELARRLKSLVRGMDTIARMGGDEFAILIESVENNEQVIAVIERIQRGLTRPFEAGRNPIVLTASFGVVMDVLRYSRIDEILRDADIAMYRAKVSGKDRYKVFDVVMREEADDVLQLESGLRRAIQNQEFRIEYQPIMSLISKRLTGFEALLRWDHPERGTLYPAEFLRAAEESGLIVPIGNWVIFDACHQLKRWQAKFDVDPPLTVSVNLSSLQFAQPDLIEQVEEALEESGLRAECLMLELTEMTLIEDIESAVAKIDDLRAMGVGVEIDDFGTGYSSLGYLRHLPVSTLKIDRSFVSTLGKSSSGVPIIRAIIAMASSLGMTVIAEGVETEDQVRNLMDLQCDLAQGFYFESPLSSESAEDLLRSRYAQEENDRIIELSH